MKANRQLNSRGLFAAMRVCLWLLGTLVLSNADALAQTINVTIHASKLSWPEGHVSVLVPGVSLCCVGTDGAVNVGPGTYEVITSSFHSYGTFTVEDLGGGSLAITATTGSLRVVSGGIDFDLSSLFTVTLNSATLAESSDSSVSLEIFGVTAGAIYADDITYYLPTGQYSVTTIWYHLYGTFTISDDSGALALSGTSGSVVSAGGGRIDFDRAQLFKLTFNSATLSDAPAYSGPNLGIFGVSAGYVIKNDTTYYLPAGEYSVATPWSHVYGNFTLSGDFGALELSETTGSIVSLGAGRIDFDRSMLMPVSLSSASLACPDAHMDLVVGGVSSVGYINRAVVIYYLPAGEYTLLTPWSHLYGTFTVSGGFGSLELTDTTGSVVATPTGIDFDPSALHTIQITPVPPLWAWSIFGVGHADGPATLRLPSGTYKLGVFSDELGEFTVSSSGLSLTPSTDQHFAVSLTSSFCNQTPIASCKNVAAFAGSSCASVADINNGSYDPDAVDTITLSQSPAGPYPLGQTLVTLTVTDSHGASSSCQATVTVLNPDPLVTLAGPANGSIFPVNTPVSFTGTFVDAGGGPHTGTWMFDELVQAATIAESTGASPGLATASHTFTAAGVFRVKLRITDACGGSATADQIGGLDVLVVVVALNSPPHIACSVTSSQLWPPNHNLINVGFSAILTPGSDPDPAVNITVYSNEDDDAPTGDGNFSPDARNIAPGALRLRVERNGGGNGRVYLIALTATDVSGNTARCCRTVTVPKSQNQADKNAVQAQAAAAAAYCMANGTPPPGYFVVGDGPIVGPKQ